MDSEEFRRELRKLSEYEQRRQRRVILRAVFEFILIFGGLLIVVLAVSLLGR